MPARTAASVQADAPGATVLSVVIWSRCARNAVIGPVEEANADCQLGASDGAVVNHVPARCDQGTNAGRHFARAAMLVDDRIEQEWQGRRSGRFERKRSIGAGT